MAIAIVVSPGLAQDGEQVKPVFEHVIPNAEGKSMVALVVTYAPGGKSPAHHHAGSAFVYAHVLSGAIRSQVGDEPVKVYQVGEGFHEVPGSAHRISENADAVIDLVGGETQERSFQVLRRGGKLISAVSPPDQHLAGSHGVEAAFFLVNVTSQRLAEIAGLIDGGQLRTRMGAVLPLADAREAHFILERVRPQPKGKIVLTVGGRRDA